MPETTRRFSPNPKEKIIYIGLAALLFCIMVFSVLRASNAELTGVQLVTILLFVFHAILAGKFISTQLSFEKDVLIHRNILVHQSVNLNALIKAERIYGLTGVYKSINFRLEDSEGKVLLFDPRDYELRDRKDILLRLTPYIFISRVQKNFTTLDFDKLVTVEPPFPSYLRILKGTLVYVLIPSVVIALIIIIWAITTNQAAFN